MWPSIRWRNRASSPRKLGGCRSKISYVARQGPDAARLVNGRPDPTAQDHDCARVSQRRAQDHGRQDADRLAGLWFDDH
jgi:hypothetical protein